MACRGFSCLVEIIALLILLHWGYGSYLQIDPDTIEIIYQVCSFLISAACIAYGIRRGWAHVVNTGVVFFVILLYTKVFDWWWELMPKYLFFFILGLIAILCLLVMQRLRKSGRQSRVDVA